MTSIAAIHVGKAKLGLDDDTYRALLLRVTGVASTKAMTEEQRQKVLLEMRRAGFKSRSKGASKPRRKASEKAYVRLIFALWRSIGEKGGLEDRSAAALKSFVMKRAGVADPEWLTYDQADPIIRALKAMEKRAAEAA